ncbi:YcjF family protein [Rhodoferax sp. WC2427]|uniref:YcjF family protein n=1 Tax=Rhodoferax sp. WC2427 TaxID=3234144 RepID=UPI003466FA34
MHATETRAIVTLSLLAAFVDGEKHERERAEIKRIAEGLSQADGLNLPTLYQDVLMKRVSLDSVAAALTSAESRQLAYEMAVCVCDADGVQSVAEQRFLASVQQTLGLGTAATAQFSQQADAMASAPLAVATPVAAAAPPQPGDAELDKTILNAAIVNGALELLPESLSTMAIIPLQMRLVYGIGKAHGFELDRGHIKDFLATVGVGLTAQYLEQAGRKLLGGLLGKLGGGLARGLGQQAVSSGMGFAATYALGHVAKRYYAGGRTLSTQTLKDAYASVAQEAQGLQGRYLPAMQETARTLDAGKVLAMVRGV